MGPVGSAPLFGLLQPAKVASVAQAPPAPLADQPELAAVSEWSAASTDIPLSAAATTWPSPSIPAFQ